MKNVILCADGDSKVYSVPDEVAEHLNKHCTYFSTTWLRTSRQAKKYRLPGGAVCYNEEDFIEYLNKWKYPGQPSTLVENLGWIGHEREIPEHYRECPRFDF